MDSNSNIVEGLFCLGGSFEIPFQRSVLKTCKYGSFTDESNELMLEDSYGYDLSYDRFDSFGSYGSKARKTLCTIFIQFARPTASIQLCGSQDEHRRRFGVCLPRFAVICLTHLSKENP